MSARWAQIKCAGCGAKNRVDLDRSSNAVCGRCQGVLLEVASKPEHPPQAASKHRPSQSPVGPRRFKLRPIKFPGLHKLRVDPKHWPAFGIGTVVLLVAGRMVIGIPVVSNLWNEVIKPNAKELYWRIKDPQPAIRLAGDRINGRLPGRSLFPLDNPWNQRVDHLPVDPMSTAIIDQTGPLTRLRADFGASYRGRPFGIPYIVVSGDTEKVPIVYTAYGTESDPGPFPIPPDVPIEGGGRADLEGDRHLITVDRDNWRLYELFRAFPHGVGYRADSGATWDMNSNALRPDGWTSGDAAGLPILPGLVRYDEVVEQGAIRHALRFTVERSRADHVPPARHHASPRRQLTFPPMGMRVRLRADYDITGFPPHARVILKALKEYGMFLADNGGNWFISGTPDPRWDDNQLRSIRRLRGQDLEVIRMPVREVKPAAPVTPPNDPLQTDPGKQTLPTELP